MKRVELIRHLRANGCEFLRSWSSLMVAQSGAKQESRNEIRDLLIKKTCKDLGIPDAKERQ
jgi:hypothetical protein